MLLAMARPLANDVPTINEPSKPGPRVNAMASILSGVIPASRSAASTTGTIFCWWAREASSGITPPYRSCTACDAMTLERSVVFRKTAADVSSHDDSMPNMIISLFIFYYFIFFVSFFLVLCLQVRQIMTIFVSYYITYMV